MVGAVTYTIGTILLFLKNSVLVKMVYQLQNEAHPLAGLFIIQKMYITYRKILQTQNSIIIHSYIKNLCYINVIYTNTGTKLANV